jgi:hypothetical protein
MPIGFFVKTGYGTARGRSVPDFQPERESRLLILGPVWLRAMGCRSRQGGGAGEGAQRPPYC